MPYDKTNFQDVGDFHAKFDLPHVGDGKVPHGLDTSTFGYRYKFLLEELAEYADAQAAPGVAAATRELMKEIDVHLSLLPIDRDKVDLAASLDALIDLNYISCGTAHLSHLPFDAGWAEVQRANMTKERATSALDARSKRGHSLDVVKPKGWRPPDLEGVIRRASNVAKRDEW